MTFETGTRVGRYEIQSLIGVGGMGEVYRALDTELDRPAALKFLPPEVAADPRRMSRFVQEAKAASALNHPNILTVYDIGQTEDGLRFFAAEFIDGTTLREHMKARRMKLGDVLDVCAQVASALASAHAAGIVHRDVKPENIMLRKDGYVKVLDFGLAKVTGRTAVDSEAATQALVNTNPGSVMGTVAYMSPEQARGLEVDHRTDIWSLGVVLYEMLAGRVPFEGKSASHVIVSILDREPPPLALHLADAPEALQEVVTDALTKDPEARFQTAKQMLAKLQRLRHRLDAGVHLDHSVAPNATAPSGEVLTGWAGAPDTSSAQTTIAALHRTAAAPSSADAAQTAGSAEHDAARVSSPRARLPRGALAALLALVAVGVAAFAGYRYLAPEGGRARAPVSRFEDMKITRLPASGTTHNAVISPDGKYVARVAEEAGRSGLRLRQVATPNERELASSPDHYYQGVTFSHDGNFIYYTQGRKGFGWRDLFRVSVVGGEPQRLLTDIDSAVTFSPDGKRLAFRRGVPPKGEEHIVAANSDGGGEEVLVALKAPLEIFNPAWSPDGRVVAYTVSGRDDEGYYVNIESVGVSDRATRTVSAARWRDVKSLAWLADGGGIVLSGRDRASLPSTPTQIWFVSYPAGEAYKITNDLNGYTNLSLTADSRTLLTLRGTESSQIWVAPASDLARARQVTTGGPNGINGVSWTPDGRVVYESDASGNQDLWVMNADGTGARQLTFDPHSDTSAVVSPDGRFVAFYSNRGVGWGIWRADSDGGNPKELVRNIDRNISLQWSPDSRWLYYVTRADFASGAVWKVSADGGEPAKITDERVGFVRLSPDGKTFFSTYREARPDAPYFIHIISADDGSLLRTLDAPDDMLGVRAWSPDGQAVDYVVVREGVPNIWRLPLAGNNARPRQLTDWNGDFIYAFAWSPDGKHLAASRGALTRDIVLIKDFR